ncbi:hypothetical protein PSACC_00494 [Paramicrosporidium saccamoebae]|uniref:Uncharacterized protein n=1 Tax=Paramicrosporidium saccamoebae TaxID=1246581 RepID=A0A2H9TPL1_9FUNG|nr:hypothetical protein PSACC_00494 [Paramicrosporidium saccamoebae]
MKLCAYKKTGTDIHKWLSGTLGMDVTTLKMANKAASIGNIGALEWIIEKNPEAFIYEDSIWRGLNSFFDPKKTAEMVIWLFNKRPGLLPSWKYLQDVERYGISLAMLEKIQSYQERNKCELQIELMDQM